MNISDFEKRMKETLDEVEYTPGEGGWAKMQQSLQQKTNTPKVLAFPAWKMAATVALLISTGFLMKYLFFTSGSITPVPAPTHPSAAQGYAQQHIRDEAAAVPVPVSNVPGRNSSRLAKQTIPVYPAYPAAGRNPQQENYNTTKEEEQLMDKVPLTEQKLDMKDIAIQPQAPVTPGEDKKKEPAYKNVPEWEPAKDQYRSGFNLGVAANVGKPSLGNFQYNVGIVARQKISEKFYAEAGISLASVQVNYSERQTFYGNMGADFVSSQPYEISYDANFASNIISIGVSPSIGFQATKNISLSVGGEINRNLNPTLNLKNGADINNKGYNMISPTRGVTNWDMGLSGYIDYKLGKKLLLNARFRQGLTQYILVNDRSFKNSGLNLGLKYYLGR
jgi:hypothetical protein